MTSRTPVTRDRIAAVALAIIDVDGTAAVTMRRVAGDLGVQAPSLYAHVRGRDEILQLAHSAVISEIGTLPSTGDWRGDLHDYYSRMHATLLAHGDVASLQFGSIPSSAESVAAFTEAIDALVAAGMPRVLAMRASERLSLYVTADAYEQWEFARRAALGEAVDPAVVNLYDLDPEQDSDDAFTFGLDLILAGVAAAAAEQSAPASP